MADGWIEHGPISLPPRRVAYGAGALVAALAIMGVVLGFRAAQRQPAGPGSTADAVGDPADKDVLVARPIEDLPPPVTAPAPDAEAQKAIDAAADAKQDLGAQTAAAQAIQAKPSKPAGSIDDILTSPAEKPPAPAKNTSEEAPPSAPVKSDVPF